MSRQLSEEFDGLFSERTGYEQLDKCIKQTLKKKSQLLLVLDYPEIPLHNNAAELDARVQARRRDISFQTMNEKGAEAKDSFMTITQTARKLGVNNYQYLYDRISRTFKMPSLASIINDRSQRGLVYDSS